VISFGNAYQVEESNNGTLKLRATTGIDGSGAESLPDNRLANVCSNEKTDTASETVALLEEFVEKDDNDAGNDKLDDLEVAMLNEII
jgi:hypothetical protein